MSYVPFESGGDPPAPVMVDPPAPKPYPGFWPAVLLVILVQVVANVLAIVIVIAKVLIEGDFSAAAFQFDLAFLGIIANGLGFGSVIYFAWRRSKVPAPMMFPLRSVSLPVWLPILLMMGGGLLVVNELSNSLVRYLPPPQVVKDIFAELLGKGKGVTEFNLEFTFIAKLVLRFIFLVIVAPVTEELLFRGIMLNGFLPRYGKIRAILASGFLFGIIHILPWQVLPAFALGLLFAWWTVETRSLWPALLAHAATNALAFFQGLFLPSEDVFKVVDQPVWLTLLGIVLLVAGTMGAAALFRRQRTRTPATLVPDTRLS